MQLSVAKSEGEDYNPGAMRGVEAAPSISSADRAAEAKKFGTSFLGKEQGAPYVKPPIGSAVARGEVFSGEIRVNSTQYVGDASIYAKQVATTEKKPKNSTAIHEAEHIALAEDDVEMATIEPGPGYLGLTVLRRPNALAAVGPYSRRRLGTWGDEDAARSMGYHPDTLASLARSQLTIKQKKVDKYAVLLEEKRTVSGHEIREARDEVDQKKEKVLLVVKTAEGEEHHETEARNGVVVFDRKKLALAA